MFLILLIQFINFDLVYFNFYSVKHIFVQFVKHVASFFTLIFSLLPVTLSWAQFEPVSIPLWNIHFSRVILSCQIIVILIAAPIYQ